MSIKQMEVYSEEEYPESIAINKANSVSIPPWYILAGLGTLDRRSLCEFLATFENISFLRLGYDTTKDLFGKLLKKDKIPAFEKRIRNATEKLHSSEGTDAWLRFRVWSEIRNSFGLEPALPLSTRTANIKATDVCEHAAMVHPDPDTNEGWLSRAKSSIRKPSRLDFSKIVQAEVQRFAEQTLTKGILESDQRKKVMKAYKQWLEQQPLELQDKHLKQAVDSGNWNLFVALAPAGSLAGVSIAVEFAGFSAYILAAQVSAIIPWLGGKTAVSTLSVVANPLLITPVLVLSIYISTKSLSDIRKQFASRLTIQMSLRGIGSQTVGLKACLDNFKDLENKDIETGNSKKNLIRSRHLVRKIVDELRPTPGLPKTNLRSVNENDTLNTLLFPGAKSGTFTEAMVVGGMTAGDIIFDAASINPEVIAAADFSRSADIDGIFNFGAFAEQIQEMDIPARAGAENNLLGYTAEQITASRLTQMGHEVSLPDSSNQPGFDLLVDGHRFQVKCYEDSDVALSTLSNHFENYPDISVYVNSEVLVDMQESGQPWADKVFGIEGYDYQTTNNILEQSLKAGENLMDLPIPLFAVTVSVARNIHGWWKGSVPLQNLPMEVVLDGAVHGSLAVAGGFTGKALGSLVFGPAGGVVFEGVVGVVAIMGSKHMKRTVNKVMMGKWLDSIDEPAERFHADLRNAMLSKLRRINEKRSQVSNSNHEFASWIRLKFSDRALAVAECVAELDSLPHEQDEKATKLLRLMYESGVHPLSVKDSMDALLTALGKRPTVTDKAREIGSLFKRMNGQNKV